MQCLLALGLLAGASAVTLESIEQRAGLRQGGPNEMAKKVTGLLGTILNKAKAELDETKSTYEKFTKQCTADKKTLGERKQSIKTELAQQKQESTTEKSNIETAQNSLDETANQLAKNEGDLEKVNKDFEVYIKNADAQKADQEKAVERTAGAMKSMNINVPVLLQNGVDPDESPERRRFDRVAQAVRAAFGDGADLDADQRATLDEFLTAGDSEDTDTTSFLQTAEKSHDDGLATTVQGIYTQIKQTLDELQQDIQTKTKTHSEKRQTLEKAISEDKEDKVKHEQKLADSKQAKAQADKAVLKLTEEQTANAAEIEAMEKKCSTGKTSYEDQIQTTEDEIKATEGAADVMKKFAPSTALIDRVLEHESTISDAEVLRMHQENLKSVAQVMADHEGDDEEPETVEAASDATTDESETEDASEELDGDDGGVFGSVGASDDVLTSDTESPSFLQVAAQRNVFDKVKGLIKDMLEKLLKQQSEEATLAEYCHKEQSENKEELKDNANELEKLNTRNTTSNAQYKTAINDKSKKSEEVSKQKDSIASANDVRQKEQASFDKNVKNADENNVLVKAAVAEMNAHFGKMKDKGRADAVMPMLELLVETLTSKAAKLRSSEAAQQRAHDEVEHQANVTIAGLQEGIKNAEKAEVSIKAAIADIETDIRAAQEQRKGLAETRESLAKKCTIKQKSYEERKAEKEAQIANLKDALSILSAEAQR